jgi:glycosyltransferase involved in cell wall biosynthesis
VGGNPPNLARYERALGLQSHCVAFRESPFGYPADEILASPGISYARFELRRWKLLWRALRHFDIVHFNFGRTILPSHVSLRTLRQAGVNPLVRRAYSLYARCLELRDLALLKKAGKGIVVTFQGDDARQGDVAQRLLGVDLVAETDPNYYTPESDTAKRMLIATFARFADRIYTLNPDLLHILPEGTQFLPYAQIDLDEWVPSSHRETARDVPLVVHAPTHRGVKGTRFILDAVERIKAEGVPLDFAVVEGLSQNHAKRLYEQADLFVDQLLLGWYGAVAVELMALGKPVVCYIRREELQLVPKEMRNDLPIIQATSNSVYHVLKEWITAGHTRRVEQGLRGRHYVERWHNPERIAGELKQAYEAILASGSRTPASNPTSNQTLP